MRGKKAKLLRRVAESKTLGLPEIRYNSGVPHRLHPQCTRRVYQGLKRGYLMARRGITL